MLTYLDLSLSFISLTIMEIVLSADNILFISLVTADINPKYIRRARRIGVLVAVMGRILLLLFISWLLKLNNTLFSIYTLNISIRDLIMIFGGIYLIFYSNKNIFKELQPKKEEQKNVKHASFIQAILMILVLDSIFSFDSVLTAISIGSNLYIMIAAILVSVIILFISIDFVSNFIVKNPNIKILALSFLILVGFSLLVSGFHIEVPKIFLFIIMVFSIFVQFISIKVYKNNNSKIQ